MLLEVIEFGLHVVFCVTHTFEDVVEANSVEKGKEIYLIQDSVESDVDNCVLSLVDCDEPQPDFALEIEAVPEWASLST